jgi:hypothetical protein
MKLLIIASVGVLFALPSFSQATMGTKTLGGRFSFYGTHEYDQNQTVFSLSPEFGYFVKDNWELGTNLNLGFSHTRIDGVSSMGNFRASADMFTYGGGIYTKYYMGLTEKLYFTMTGALNYYYRATHYTTAYDSQPSFNSDVNLGDHTASLTVSPGFAYFIIPRLSLHANVTLMHYTLKTGSNSGGTFPNFSHNYGLQLTNAAFSVGLKFHF